MCAPLTAITSTLQGIYLPINASFKLFSQGCGTGFTFPRLHPVMTQHNLIHPSQPANQSPGDPVLHFRRKEQNSHPLLHDIESRQRHRWPPLRSRYPRSPMQCLDFVNSAKCYKSHKPSRPLKYKHDSDSPVDICQLYTHLSRHRPERSHSVLPLLRTRWWYRSTTHT
jgi:hypothetical protein